MKLILQLLSLVGLLMTIVPPVLFFLSEVDHQAQNAWMLAGAVIWFVSASFWLGKKSKSHTA